MFNIIGLTCAFPATRKVMISAVKRFLCGLTNKWSK